MRAKQLDGCRTPRAALDARAYAEPAVLRDGGSLLVRALQPDDKEKIVALFRRLSPESIRHRVFVTKTRLTDEELAYLTEVDFDRHVALAAVLDDDIIAVGRYYSSVDHRRAELAFVVADEHQARGIGTVLLEHLVRIARASGVEELEADVMADNVRMMDVFTESGFSVEKTLASSIYHVRFPSSATEEFLRASTAREQHAAAESVRVFFEPKSVALIGASRRDGSIGHAILSNLQRCGYTGPIYPINPSAQEILGLPAFPTVEAAPGKVDLAIIAVPAPEVEDVIVACVRAHVRGVLVISSGFAETGTAGRELQQRLRTLVRRCGMRMVGPNCMGVLNASPSVSLDATFAPTWPPAGNVSMLSQSGALGIAILDHAARLNVGLAGFVSVGNKADVSGNDLLSYWADDPATKVIALYLESFGNPRKFARIAPEVARRKPIVAVKAGRSVAGTRAATSHSAALASADVGVDALFQQAGVIRTDTLEQLFDVVALLATQPLPAGRRVGVVTNAGGPGILLADACEAQGLELPELAPETLAELRRYLPATAGLSNPVDMIASATVEHYERTIAAVGNDPNVDALVAIYIPPLVTKPEDVAAAIAAAAGRVPANKPLVTVFMSAKGTPEVLSTGPRGKLPSYSFPENAAFALAAATRYATWRSKPRGHVHTIGRDRRIAIRRYVEKLLARNASPFWLTPVAVARVLELAEIPLVASRVVPPGAEHVVSAAREMGYPLVVKAVASGLVHKTEIGGVILGVDTEAAAMATANTLADRAARAGHPLEGILLQREVAGGIEAIVGVTVDPSFGPLLVAGLGGVQVELLRDVGVRLTPVSDLDAAEMLTGLRSAKLLDGYRGAPALDRSALEALITKLSALVEVIPELVELDLNPVKVLPRGEGVTVLDARIRLSR